jgi:hypothetical protein
MLGGFLPPLGQITFWVRASRALDGAITWLRRIDTSGIVATSGSFKHLDVSKYTNGGEKLMVSILDTINHNVTNTS